MKNLGLQRMVEVGCKEGRTTEFILQHLPEATVTTVDPWAVVPGAPADNPYASMDFARIEAEFWQRTKPFGERVRHLRMTSVEASSLVAGEPPFDLVFIDADHHHEFVLQDIDSWRPRVRPGGVLSGHDYQHKFPGVHRAVADRFCLLDVGLADDSVWFVTVG
jgi:predicted O-methyltransferase YrrM